MIIPNVRATFGRREVHHLVRLIGGSDEDARRATERRLTTEGIDSLLDDPRVLNALLADPDVNVPPTLVFYVLVRQALLEGGIEDVAVADYVTALVVEFGRGRRAYRIAVEDDREYHYLVDMVSDLETATGKRSFLLRAHLGNYSLWLTGLFPDYVAARVQRRGAPPLAYYEDLGASGYRAAAESAWAEAYGLDRIYRSAASTFTDLRSALNRVGDRYLWRGAGDPVARLLRQVSDRFRRRGR